MYTNLLITIKNAGHARKQFLKVPYSGIDFAIAEVLARYRFLRRVEVKGRTAKRVLEIECNPDRPIQGVRFLSKPSLRRYMGYREIKPVKRGYGLLVLTTPRGIKSGNEAKREKVGGQALFEVW